MKTSGLSALILIVCVLFFCFFACNPKTVPVEDNAGIRIPSNDYGDEPVPSWFGSLTYEITTEKKIYSPSETPVIKLKYGLINDNLGDGTLKILIATESFSVDGGKDITIPDYTYDAHSGKCADSTDVTPTPVRQRIRSAFYHLLLHFGRPRQA